MEYEYKKMLSDIRQDLAKYAALYPIHTNKPPNMLKVLLHSPAFYVIASYRILYWLKVWQETLDNHLVNILFIPLRLIVCNSWAIIMKIQITDWPEIGPGLYLSNRGGIIMGPSRIGSGCVIHHNVTIGMNQNEEHPDIGNNVWIGSNSVIYGKIIKDGVIVYSNTVVGKNVPACVAIKGNPGRIIHRNIDNLSFLSSYYPHFKNGEEKPYV